MKRMFIALLLAGLYNGVNAGGNYGPIERYNDSLRIYNTYKSEITLIKSIKSAEYQIWYDRQANDDSLTACAKRRLQVYNGHTYVPVQTYDREGLGEAALYPAPSQIHHDGEFVSALYQFQYATVDYQTRFITYNDGKTRIPFILKSYYDKGRLLYCEKLNPVTFEKMQDAEAPAAALQASNSVNTGAPVLAAEKSPTASR